MTMIAMGSRHGDYVLDQLGRLAVDELGEQELLDRALVAVAAGLDVEYVKVLECVSDDTLVVRSAVGWPPELRGATLSANGAATQAGLAVSTGAPVVIDDLRTDARFEAAVLHEEGIVSGVAVALPHAGETIGVLAVHTRRQRTFSEAEVRLLDTAALVLASALLRMRAVDSLRRSEAHLRLILGSIPALLVGVDRDLRYTTFEGTGTRLVGLEPGALVGRRVAEYFDPETAPFVEEQYRRALGGEALTYELAWADRDWQVSYEPLLDAGEVVGAIGLSVDITDLKRTQAELAAQSSRLAMLIDASVIGVIVMDLDGIVTLWNPAAEAMFGWTAAEIVGKPYPLAADAAQRAEFVTNLRKVGGGTPLIRDFQRRRKDGRPIHLRGGGGPVRDADGTVNGVIGLYVDITDQKTAESALADLNAELEARIDERTEALEAANSELEAFSYSVSHDLRAPLRAIDGFSQALEEDCARQLDDTGRDHLVRIRAATARMATLIDDLLHLSRISKATMTLTRIDLSALVDELVRERAAGDPERQVTTSVEPGLDVLGDPGLVRALFTNLIDNAWKFTVHASDPRIEIARDPATGAIVVRDNGVGFDPEHAARLFTPFQRLHAASEYPGTGIGLATVQRIVNRHQGRIWAESTPGHGASFYVQLPD